MSGFEVLRVRCDQCLFTANRIVSSRRMAEVLAECRASDSHFVCHKSTIAGGHACCRGFYDRNPDASNIMRIAARLGAVQFIDVPTLPLGGSA